MGCEGPVGGPGFFGGYRGQEVLEDLGIPERDPCG